MLPEDLVFCYKFASRSRPAKFIQAIENIIWMHTPASPFFILASLDQDDSSMTTPAMGEWIKARPYIHAHYGLSGTKIRAINRDMDKAPNWHLLVNMSDDMRWVAKGANVRIAKDMLTHFPDLDGFLHYPDGSDGGKKLATMSIMGRQYYDRTGSIYNPEYTSLWCDNEATEVAQKLGKYAYVPEQLFDHQHPAHGKADTDAQYRHTESFFWPDKAVYDRRKAANFGL